MGGLRGVTQAPNGPALLYSRHLDTHPCAQLHPGWVALQAMCSCGITLCPACHSCRLSWRSLHAAGEAVGQEDCTGVGALKVVRILQQADRSVALQACCLTRHGLCTLAS